MSQPRVSVIMPVYNAARFLEEAVQSILCQKFSELELLIIDDGSTDESSTILDGIADDRVTVYRNERNHGIAATLNRGIAFARGEYIARMDADDISLPHRIEKQVAFLDSHPEISVVGVKCRLIDAYGNDAGLWDSDSQTVSTSEICAMLPVSNCIAHPGIMIRKDVLTAFQYNTAHRHSQDYDLWLRLSAAGHRLEKLDEVLLKYRVLPNSTTATTHKRMGRFKSIQTKWLYLLDHFRSRLPINSFVCRVAAETIREVAAYVAGRVSDFAHSLARKLLRQAGRCLGAVLKVSNPSGIYFFFPYYHVGGAERVHADILAAVEDVNPWVFFTNRSKNDAFLRLFEGRARTFNIAPLLDNVFSKHIAAGILIERINCHAGATVFGANSIFFYELLPFMSRSVRCIDLIHAFGSGVEDVSLPFVEHLDLRVVISEKTIADLRCQYLDYDLPGELLDRVTLINNKIDPPLLASPKGANDRIQVIFVGRDAVEKRVALAGTIAKMCVEGAVGADYLFVGDFASDIHDRFGNFCSFAGEVSSFEELEKIYEAADLLLLTSEREGVPMVMIEAMTHGTVPICTDVGGIPYHITNGVNGFLVSRDNDEDAIAFEFVRCIKSLVDERDKLRTLSAAARQYSVEHFSGASFRRSYRQLLGLAEEPE